MPDVIDRARTPLLTLITQQALDEDYEVAARRRAGAVPGAPRGRSRQAAVGATVAFGVLLSMAFLHTTRNEGVDSASRNTLIDRIESRRAEVAELQDRIAALRSENADLTDQVTRLTNERQEAQVAVEELEATTGFAPVTGPGLRVTVVTTPGAGPDAIQDSDLAMLVDGLWAAGAEAISVNGQRLTARSAIRISGTAVEVNSSGIAPPYHVLAIGDTNGMWADFFNTDAGLNFDGLSREYEFDYEIEPEDDLTLAGAPRRLRSLRSAVADVDEAPEPGGGPKR